MNKKFKLLIEAGISPGVLTVINFVLQKNSIQILADEYIDEAQKLGFIKIKKNQIILTPKARQIILELFQIARAEGEL